MLKANLENTDARVSPVIDFVSAKDGIRICFYPDSCHGIFEYLVVFQNTCSVVVDQHTAVLTTPNFVPGDFRIWTCSDLHSRVEVVEDIISFEKSVAIILQPWSVY